MVNEPALDGGIARHVNPHREILKGRMMDAEVDAALQSNPRVNVLVGSGVKGAIQGEIAHLKAGDTRDPKHVAVIGISGAENGVRSPVPFENDGYRNQHFRGPAGKVTGREMHCIPGSGTIDGTLDIGRGTAGRVDRRRVGRSDEQEPQREKEEESQVHTVSPTVSEA